MSPKIASDANAVSLGYGLAHFEANQAAEQTAQDIDDAYLSAEKLHELPLVRSQLLYTGPPALSSKPSLWICGWESLTQE